MYLVIHLLLIFVSLLSIAIIIWRKKSYINKLALIESEPDSDTYHVSDFSMTQYWQEFFPEISELISGLKLDHHKTIWLIEIEKLLRKTRLISLRMDNFFDFLIKKIRRVHTNGKLNSHLNEAIKSTSSESAIPTQTDNISEAELSYQKSVSSIFLKNEEEKLIIEIAQNPKDPTLYGKLGDLYFEMEEFNDAKESYEAAIELVPQDESLKQKLSLALEKINVQN